MSNLRLESNVVILYKSPANRHNKAPVLLLMLYFFNKISIKLEI